MQSKNNPDMRIKCQQIAYEYEKKQSTESRSLRVTVAVRRVEFSPSYNSCLAAVTRAICGPRSGERWQEVIDLQSEVLFSS